MKYVRFQFLAKYNYDQNRYFRGVWVVELILGSSFRKPEQGTNRAEG
jgi:hypothetical protein